MNTTPTLKSRFAPSPTGLIHLGNARTALFSALLAWRQRGHFLLRIEDTDRERSRDEYAEAVQTDLRWLGLEWQEGPSVEGAAAPYFQSARGAIYDEHYRALEAQGHAYPCFCTPEELDLSRRAQRASGQAPRYSGKCANLNPDEVQRRLDTGQPYTLRFRVPRQRSIEFDDLVRGPQRFRGEDIGDFIIRRADGSAAFFFCNAVDDALMGVTDVLRGEDHLTNTPRQLLILEALRLTAPRYGHITTILGPDGTPLSKRNGSRSIQELREAGYLPLAVVNYLARLGHSYESDAYMDLTQLAAAFEIARLGKAPARFDERQLLFWQQEAVANADEATLWSWMGEAVAARVPESQRTAFMAAVRPNVRFPAEALHWAQVCFDDALSRGGEAAALLRDAGGDFFRAALEALEAYPDDFKAFANQVKAATGARGKGLFMPLRVALTGETGGPEMGQLLPLIGAERARRRLADCVELNV